MDLSDHRPFFQNIKANSTVKINTLRYLPSARIWVEVFSLLRESSPRLTVISIFLIVTEIAAGLGVLLLIKWLIDALTAEAIGEIFTYLACVFGALLIAALTQAASAYVRVAQGIAVGEAVTAHIHDRAVDVDLAFYESPAYFDSLERARRAGPQRPAQVVSNLFLLTKSAIFLIGAMIMLAAIEWRILPAVLLSVAAVLVVRLWFTRRAYQWQRDKVQLERRASYADWLITSDHHAKELRIGGLAAYLIGEFQALRLQINTGQLAIEKRRARAEVLVSGVGAIVFAGAVAFLVIQTAEGQQTIGDLVLFVLLFRRVEASGREFVQNMARLYDDQLFLSHLFDFLDVKPLLDVPRNPVSIPAPLKAGLHFENVRFCYPANDTDALTAIDMVIKPGQIVALVGENGSGKTSLIKLLTRLYDPNEGRITLDGTDIRRFDPAAYRNLFGVVFQDFARYASSATENIGMGDIDRRKDLPAIKAAAETAAARGFIDILPRGFNTPLTRMFDDGRELSIGQWQRLALARTFFKDASFLILDEPSSALDPQAEFDLFENFREKISGRAALVISHRLSTVRLADYTYVLDKGRIIEAGTHDELVAKGGKYATLFETQGRSYRN